MNTFTKPDHYRSAVGPPDKYDIIGALQFNVMVSEGLRDHHKLLDLGCGSLRGGRLFMVWLRKNNYFGIEPNESLVWAGIRNEIGDSVLATKYPKFLYTPHFDLAAFGVQFDFILAQSVFSHAAPQMIRKCLGQARLCLKPSGKFIMTYFIGGSNYNGTTWAQQPDARYTEGWMKATCKGAGFNYVKLNHPHPSGQTWVRLTQR